ncbi:transketolase [Enterocloster lavalensis]|uniref:transketolase n=1 Tax=Enterocloster lavalensis TaxID=460384 RepID=UPI001D090905|nr:transketolase [Enterocloster lavalensis]MCB6345826.1 transketolase [Enterocloster lavalensis]
MIKSDKKQLEQTALRIRLGIIRAISSNHGGHIGGSLDLAEMLAVVYSDFMRVDPKNPRLENRDFMIFSKGHAGPALYAALAEKGYFPAERLENLNKMNNLLPGHCDRNKVPGVDATTGSLGQGLSIACGIALSAKATNRDQRVFCVTGDGESAEGQIWEAAQFAAHYKLDNLVAFLDWNKMQIDGSNDEVMSLGDPVAKYQAFGWNACKVVGSDVLAIQEAVARAVEAPNRKPNMIVLDTIKGQGSQSIMEMSNNHCIGFPADLEQKVKQELKEQGEKLGVEVK